MAPRGVVRVAALALTSGALLLGVSGCKRPGGGEVESASPASPPRGPLAEARALIEAGQLDQALARLQGAPGGEAFYLQGVVWARKAQTAPLPTPPPPAADAPRRAPPPRAPELKPEEILAVDFFDQAVRAEAHLAVAHLAAADLLAPHALRAFDQQAVARSRRTPRGAAPAASVGPAPGEPDWSVAGVLQRYQQAVSADTRGPKAVDALLAFATRVGDLDAVDTAYRELIRRDRESSGPLVRYGDFLRDARKEPLRAVEQYQQALIWRPDDEATRAKLADVYIELGIEHFKKHEYMAAQMRLDEAAKHVKDPNSPQGLRLRDYTGKLKEIRGGR